MSGIKRKIREWKLSLMDYQREDSKKQRGAIIELYTLAGISEYKGDEANG